MDGYAQTENDAAPDVIEASLAQRAHRIGTQLRT